MDLRSQPGREYASYFWSGTELVPDLVARWAMDSLHGSSRQERHLSQALDGNGPGGTATGGGCDATKSLRLVTRWQILTVRRGRWDRQGSNLGVAIRKRS